MNRVKELREQKNLSQAKLAQMAGLAQSSIHNIETGQNSPTLRALEKLAFALSVSIAELLGESQAANLNRTGTG